MLNLSVLGCLAFDMFKHGRHLGLHCGWARFDSLLDSNAAFISELEKLGETFVSDTNTNTKV